MKLLSLASISRLSEYLYRQRIWYSDHARYQNGILVKETLSLEQEESNQSKAAWLELYRWLEPFRQEVKIQPTVCWVSE